MKISKASWIFLVAGILVIASVGLGTASSTQIGQQTRLTQELARAKQKLALINIDELLAREDQLTRQIETTQMQLELAREKLFSPQDSISATNLILETARAAGVEIRTIGSSGESSADLMGARCTALTLNIQVEGRMSDLTAFIIDLSRRFPTGLVNTANLDSSGESEEPAEDELDSSPPETPSPHQQDASAAVTLIIYSYAGK